jgi:glutaredoxin
MVVILYAMSTCPWCQKAKKYFAEHNIEFDCTDYDLADKETRARIKREMDAEETTSFPFVRIGDHVVIGYRPEAYARLLDMQDEQV